MHNNVLYEYHVQKCIIPIILKTIMVIGDCSACIGTLCGRITIANRGTGQSVVARSFKFTPHTNGFQMSVIKYFPEMFIMYYIMILRSLGGN